MLGGSAPRAEVLAGEVLGIAHVPLPPSRHTQWGGGGSGAAVLARHSRSAGLLRPTGLHFAATRKRSEGGCNTLDINFQVALPRVKLHVTLDSTLRRRGHPMPLLDHF